MREMDRVADVQREGGDEGARYGKIDVLKLEIRGDAKVGPGKDQPSGPAASGLKFAVRSGEHDGSLGRRGQTG